MPLLALAFNDFSITLFNENQAPQEAGSGRSQGYILEGDQGLAYLWSVALMALVTSGQKSERKE